MKKIYLILVFCCLYFAGYSTTWYSQGGLVTLEANWNTNFLGGPLTVMPAGYFPGSYLDTFIVQNGMVMPNGTWSINGTLMFFTTPLCHINKAGALPSTINIGTTLILNHQGTISSPLSGGIGHLTINDYGDLWVADSGKIGPPGTGTNFMYIHCADTLSTVASPKIISWNSVYTSDSTALIIDSRSVRRLLTNVALPVKANVSDSLNGTLICGSFKMFSSNTDTFTISPGATIYTAASGGLDYSLQSMYTEHFSGGAHYIYNGSLPQITGTTLPTAFVAPGSVTINNSAGVNLLQPTTFDSASFVNLEQGVFNLGGNLTMHHASGVNVDNGNFDSSPAYGPMAYGRGVNITYMNLGVGAPATNTGNELLPTPLTTTIGKVTVNKAGATIALNSAFTANDSIILTSGTLNASFFGNYTINANSHWVNNASPAAFNPQLALVNFSGTTGEQMIEGTFKTTFYDLTLNNPAGAQIVDTEFVNHTLTLTSGKLYMGNNDLYLGASATPVAGAFSSANMIVANTAGHVNKQWTAPGGFFFPVGDSVNYSPTSLSLSAGTFGANAGVRVNLKNIKHPNNVNTAACLKRYWHVIVDSMAGYSYSDTAYYVPVDVVPMESGMAMGEYNGSLPWKKYYAVDLPKHRLFSGFLSDSIADFTGISIIGPAVVASPHVARICKTGTASDTVRMHVLSSTGDPGLTYTWSPPSFLSATTGTSVLATYSAAPTAIYNYTVTITDGNGFTAFDTVKITVDPAPAISGVTTNAPVCAGDTLIITANMPANVTTYSWAGPVSITSGGTTAVAKVSPATLAADGTYTVTLTNGVDSGCTTRWVNMIPVTVNPLPAATSVTASGTYCGQNVITATGGAPGTIFFQGNVSGGTSTLDPFSTYTVTTTGTYYFRAQNTLTGCWGAQGSVHDSINVLPTAYGMTGGGNYCVGDSGVHVGLSVTDTGISYQLERDSLFVGASIMGTGFPIDFGLKTLAGGYYILATNIHSGCTNFMFDSVIVDTLPLPIVFTVHQGNGYCTGGLGDSVYMDGSESGIFYQLYWIDTFSGLPVPQGISLPGDGSAPFYFGQFTNRGLYIVIGQNAGTGCIRTMAGHDSVWINPLPTVYSVTGGGVDCFGGPGFDISLDSSSVGTTYVLYADGSYVPGSDMPGTGHPISFGFQAGGTPAYPFPAVTTYTVSATNSWGCTASMAGMAVVTVNPLPPQYNVSPANGRYCARDTNTFFHVTLGGSDPGIRYRLSVNGITTGAPLYGNGAMLDFGPYNIPGMYTIYATDTATGCSQDAGGPGSPFGQISVDSLPLVFHLTGGGHYCSGDAGVHMYLTGSEAGMTYYLYGPGLPQSFTGTGFTLDFGLQTAAGTYYLLAHNSDPLTAGCNNAMLDSAKVVIDPLPTVYTVTGGGNYCTGFATPKHIGLSGSDTGISYVLFRDGLPVDTLMGTHDSLNFGATTITGVYTVVGTNVHTGCTNPMADSSSINSFGLPAVFTVSGGGAYCSGTGGVPINLSGSESGIDYQLYLLGAPVGSIVHGTGAAFTFGYIITGGTYTVLATNVATGCTITMTGSAFVFIKPLPLVYTIAGAGPYCEGDTGRHVYLSGSITNIHYQLYMNGTAIPPFHYGTGSGLDFGLFTTSLGADKIFRIIASDTVSGCSVYMTDSVTLHKNPAPSVFAMMGGGSYCAGGAGITLVLGGSQVGMHYQLYKGGVVDGLPVNGTGSAISFGAHTAAGSYTVIATNVATGCTSAMTGSALIIINPLPTVYNLTGGGNYCSGDTGVYVGLSGSDYGIRYQLYKGWMLYGGPHGAAPGPLTFGLMTPSGSYTAIAIDSISSCTDTMHGSVTVSINPLPPVHNVTGGGVYCAGETGVHVGLNGSNGGIDYQLYAGSSASGGLVGGTGSPLDFGLKTAAGTYIVTARDTTTSCADTMSGSVTVTIQPNLVPVVTLTAHPGLVIGVGDLDTVVATVTGAGAPTFQWYLNGNLLPGATTNIFVFTVYFDNDSIVCKVTSHGLCGETDTSKMVIIHLKDVSVKQILASNSDIRLIPNPNKGVFNLRGTIGIPVGIGNDQEVYVEVTNTLGQVVYKNKIMAAGGIINERIELNGNLANGMYLLNLRSGSVNSVFHFVVEQ